jgi:hypothetical protein
MTEKVYIAISEWIFFPWQNRLECFFMANFRSLSVSLKSSHKHQARVEVTDPTGNISESITTVKSFILQVTGHPFLSRLSMANAINFPLLLN